MLQLNTNGAEFIKRHIGPSAQDTEKMLAAIGIKSVTNLLKKQFLLLYVLKNQCKFQKDFLNLKCCSP
jgi:glycine cleavage system pyridoxal-binding protein P